MNRTWQQVVDVNPQVPGPKEGDSRNCIPRGIPEEGLRAPTFNRSQLECAFFLPESPHPLTVIPVWRWLRGFLLSVKPEMLEDDFTSSRIRMLSAPPQKCPLNPCLLCRAWGWGGWGLGCGRDTNLPSTGEARAPRCPSSCSGLPLGNLPDTLLCEACL